MPRYTASDDQAVEYIKRRYAVQRRNKARLDARRNMGRIRARAPAPSSGAADLARQMVNPCHGKMSCLPDGDGRESTCRRVTTRETISLGSTSGAFVQLCPTPKQYYNLITGLGATESYVNQDVDEFDQIDANFDRCRVVAMCVELHPVSGEDKDYGVLRVWQGARGYDIVQAVSTGGTVNLDDDFHTETFMGKDGLTVVWKPEGHRSLSYHNTDAVCPDGVAITDANASIVWASTGTHTDENGATLNDLKPSIYVEITGHESNVAWEVITTQVLQLIPSKETSLLVETERPMADMPALEAALNAVSHTPAFRAAENVVEIADKAEKIAELAHMDRVAGVLKKGTGVAHKVLGWFSK
jgi:hypothetical protein